MNAAVVAPPRSSTVVPNAVIGMLFFLGTEAMFFAGLISACLVLRAGSLVWPSPQQPRLPAAVTLVNMLVLLGSGYTMWRALAANRNGSRDDVRRWLAFTATLGATFLVIQGSEWISLLHHGLLESSATYGGVFYTLIGAHGVHVLGGVVLLFVVWRRMQQASPRGGNDATLEACRLYWSFVVGIWPVLYVLVYGS